MEIDEETIEIAKKLFLEADKKIQIKIYFLMGIGLLRSIIKLIFRRH